MPDTQIHPTGVVQAPGDFVIPASAEIVLKTVYASFDGSGAAGDFLPLLRIISDAGSVVAEAVADTTVVAGGSADVTWFPRVGGGGGGTPFTGLSWAAMFKDPGTLADTGFGDTSVSLDAGSFTTSDTSAFAQGAVAGVNGIKILTAGSYQVWATLDLQLSTAPAAGAYCVLEIFDTGIVTRSRLGEGLWMKDDASEWRAFAYEMNVIELGGISFPVPDTITIGAGQNSGHTADLLADLYVLRLGPRTS